MSRQAVTRVSAGALASACLAAAGLTAAPPAAADPAMSATSAGYSVVREAAGSKPDINDVRGTFTVPSVSCTGSNSRSTMAIELRMGFRDTPVSRLAFNVACTRGHLATSLTFEGTALNPDPGAPAYDIEPGDSLEMHLYLLYFNGQTRPMSAADVYDRGPDGEIKTGTFGAERTIRPSTATSAGCGLSRPARKGLPSFTPVRWNGCAVITAGPVTTSLAQRGARVPNGTILQTTLGDSSTGPVVTVSSPTKSGAFVLSQVHQA